MRKLIFILVLFLLASPTIAGDFNEVITYIDEVTYSVTVSTSGTHDYTGMYARYATFPSIENYKYLTALEVLEAGAGDYIEPGGLNAGTFTAKIGASTIGSGRFEYIYSSDDIHDRYVMYFDNWDITGKTGNTVVEFTYNTGTGCNFKDGSSQYFNGYTTAPTIAFGGDPRTRVGPIYQTTVSALYQGEITIEETDFEYGGTNLTYLTYKRTVGGATYPATIDARVDADTVYIDNYYAVSGTNYAYMDTYPVYINVSFGYPTHVYTWSKVLTGDNPELNVIDVTPTATPTITPTATPTPVPELCGYWSLAVNTSNILMNEYVQGTLTETDTSDRYDMIDWYRVMPSGQEILALHYVYDPGLFGLGAGWFEVTPTGTAYASSLAEALENDIQFTTAGANHLRVKIYDDVSILPLVYHDYDLVCSLDQVVYVGGTTQASNTLGINVKECDTNALLTGVSIGVYDYLTGQWINKTSEYGGTTYFNVVPGHNVRVLTSKSGWLSSDTDYTIPASPGLYEVCLKRPLVDVVNESYVFFNVRDSVTLTGLFQANIQLSDGQIQNTLPSGYAGFSVNDSETYIYTVTKPGYQSFSDSFSISEDTTIPVKLVQISPTPTLTYPITTLPTVTITGTGTVTPTGTGTGVWSNTTATLSPADKTYKTTKGIDIWYANLETLSGLLFVAAVFGAIGLISDSMSRRRRR